MSTSRSSQPAPPALDEPGELALELTGITKRYPGVVACDQIDLDLRTGEILALLGENGAGKSTLMNVLYGLTRPDEGEIRVRGELVEMDSPSVAIANGIGMVHQHFMLVPVMTVAQNIVLALEPTAGPLYDRATAFEQVRAISDRYGLAVDPRATVEDISVGQQQRVEILKALYRGADILILDEPTAVLTPQEADELADILRGLTDQGKSVIFITHKLHEVTDVADRVTVIRRGKKVDTIPAAGATEQSLAELMVGREVSLTVEKTARERGEPLLVVEDLVVHGESADTAEAGAYGAMGQASAPGELIDPELAAGDGELLFPELGPAKVKGVSFTVHAGEILGIAGVDGNGQSQLIDAITGLTDPTAGSVTIDGHDITRVSPKKVLEAGVGHIPTDRQVRGLVLGFSLAENCAIHDFDAPPFSRWGITSPRRMEQAAAALIEEFDVRGGGPRTSASSLSGGNQQKVIIAREVSRDPRVLIAAQPTRGVDVGAIEFLHKRLVEERDEGRGILLISLELDEVMSLSDRILVISDGRFVGEFPGDVDKETLGRAMLGSDGG